MSAPVPSRSRSYRYKVYLGNNRKCGVQRTSSGQTTFHNDNTSGSNMERSAKSRKGQRWMASVLVLNHTYYHAMNPEKSIPSARNLTCVFRHNGRFSPHLLT
ncbi:hypothetical protein AFLA_003855 [Aspergillus flavus NRRL3357]|nr:hypothetical protein AFLA_003855 [Aspergillus flavus NRRL3357]